MARYARIVARDYPHHVTARGNRREPIFFENGDHVVYRDLLAEQAEKAGVGIWAYCLMPNHVHLIAVPGTTTDLPVPSERRTGATPTTLTRERGFADTSSRIASARW